MKMRYLQNGFTVALIICALIFVVSCGSTGEEKVPSSVGSISLSASPASIPADGFSTSTVTAALLDNDGNPLSESGTVPVSFSTNLGMFTENGSSEYTAYTESGENTVTASLSASGEEGTARVTVTAEGTTKQI
ncbi:MAG: Ig-like domain-containing protein, partial [Thermodesulfobacteriota bacterium]|nr:Ig-like domain-containing protein [Thermodesulfobacteriota bacterium]